MSDHHCRRCGASAPAPPDGLPVGWSIVVEQGRTERLCRDCTRENVRNIEAKLDEAWW